MGDDPAVTNYELFIPRKLHIILSLVYELQNLSSAKSLVETPCPFACTLA